MVEFSLILRASFRDIIGNFLSQSTQWRASGPATCCGVSKGLKIKAKTISYTSYVHHLKVILRSGVIL